MYLTLLALAASPAAAQSGADTVLDVARPDRLVEPMRRLRAAEAHIAAEPGATHTQLERLGALYLIAVDDERYMEHGFAVLDTLLAQSPEIDAAVATRLAGYHGAFTVLRAKHSFWPHHKLRHVRDGLRALDEAVAREPTDATLRYLRLMSGFYLPALFGRKDEVREDFAALCRLLPSAPSHFPGAMHATVARFLLEHGEPAAEERLALEAIAHE